MPRAAAGDVIVITSSSSSEEGGDALERSASSSRPAVAADSFGGKNRDGLSKKRKKNRKEDEEHTGAVAGGEVRRGGAESGQARKEKGKEATFPSFCAGVAAVATGGEVARPCPTYSFPHTNPVKRLEGGESGGGGGNSSGGKNADRAKKGKMTEREEETSRIASVELLKQGEAKAKKKKKKKEKEKEATFASSCTGDVVAAGNEVVLAIPTWSSPANPAKRLVAGSDCGSTGNGGGGNNSEWAKKNKGEDLEKVTSAAANGEARRKGKERKPKVKKKDKNGDENEKKMASPLSYAGDVVAPSDEVDHSFGACSFPMRRVKRIILDSEDGGGHGSIRTSLDAVFLINKASELFLDLFAQDAYAHATQEHKRAVFYKHLSSTVCNGKRYEFLSDFVPEKVRAEDALKALAEQS